MYGQSTKFFVQRQLQHAAAWWAQRLRYKHIKLAEHVIPTSNLLHVVQGKIIDIEYLFPLSQYPDYKPVIGKHLKKYPNPQNAVTFFEHIVFTTLQHHAANLQKVYQTTETSDTCALVGMQLTNTSRPMQQSLEVLSAAWLTNDDTWNIEVGSMAIVTCEPTISPDDNFSGTIITKTPNIISDEAKLINDEDGSIKQVQIALVQTSGYTVETDGTTTV